MADIASAPLFQYTEDMQADPKENALSTDLSRSPQLAPLPDSATPRLIDTGMLHYEASVAGFAERYGRGETSHTIHVWWARRPHSAMRALVFASLCKDISDKSEELLLKLSGGLSSSAKYLRNAGMILESQYGYPPRVLDMFGGGGTIPMEAAALAAQAYSIDANQMSVFIQSCNLVYSQNINRMEIAAIVKESGTRVLKSLAKESAPLFPLRDKGVFGYIWTYSLKCQSCQYEFYLSKRPWLSRKKGKHLGIAIIASKKKQTTKIQTLKENGRENPVWLSRGSMVNCPKCSAEHKNIDIRQCSDKVVALIKHAEGTGKDFIEPVANAVLEAQAIAKLEQAVLKKLKAKLPDTELPRWSGIVNPALYGVRTHADFFNPRQRVVLLLLINALRKEYKNLKAKYDENMSKYVICLLSSLIDQVIDWNCRFSMWIAQNEQVGRSFCGPGISMLWDYTESDPALKGPANLWSKLERIATGAASIEKFSNKVCVSQGQAQNLTFPDKFFDAIITDPPYYDNIFYSVLADFFYSWKRLLLKDLDPVLFASTKTDCDHELVASKFRSGNKEKAHEDYCHQLSKALAEAERVLKEDGIFSFIYSHSSIKGWDALIKAYRASNFRITSVQPLSIERKARPRAMTSDAVNTCLTFIGRRCADKRSPLKLAELKSKVQIFSGHFATSLTQAGWSEADAALAVYAHAVGMIANASRVLGAKDDLEALIALEALVQKRFSGFRLASRGSI